MNAARTFGVEPRKVEQVWSLIDRPAAASSLRRRRVSAVGTAMFRSEFLFNRGDHVSPTPSVSIVIPLHNDEEWVANALESCIGQSLRNIEVVCVDDASTD